VLTKPEHSPALSARASFLATVAPPTPSALAGGVCLSRARCCAERGRQRGASRTPPFSLPVRGCAQSLELTREPCSCAIQVATQVAERLGVAEHAVTVHQARPAQGTG
jgi:hypothetical protein